MELPPKQAKKQVMQRVTATPVAEEKKPAKENDASNDHHPASETTPVTQNSQNKAPADSSKLQHEAATPADAEPAPEVSHEKFRPQASPAAPLGKLKRGPQMSRQSHSPRTVTHKPLERNLPRRPAQPQEDPSTALRRRLDAGLQETSDSLPVLRAFQEFLDVERKRSRRQVTILATCFTIILALVITSGVLGGLLFMKPLKDEYSAMRESLESYKTNDREFREYVQSSLLKADSDLQKEKTKLTSTKDSISLLTETYDNTISDLKKIIETLNNENTTLKEDMLAMKTDMPSINRELNRALEEIAELRADFHPAPELHKEYSTKTYVTVDVKPEGLKRSINLRLPIEE